MCIFIYVRGKIWAVPKVKCRILAVPKVRYVQDVGGS